VESYDVVVIGAGNAGLTASASLAQRGFKVLLLERHNIPGGSATSFIRGRFEFEVALHQLSGIGTPEMPAPLRFLFDELGVFDQLEFVRMPDLYRVLTPEGLDLTLKTDRAEAIAALQTRFPKEKEAIERFFDLVYQFAGQIFGAVYMGDPQVTREKYPLLYQLAFKNCKDILDEYFQDPLLKMVLSVYWGYLGLPPDRLAFAYLAILLFAFIEFKAYHVKGGSQAISGALAEAFIRNGGTVRFNCGADKILVDQGRVTGVVTEQGDQVETKCVISNASQVTTYVRMIDAEHRPADALREMRGRSLSPSALVMWLGLDCEPDQVNMTATTNFIITHNDLADRRYREMNRRDFGDDLMVVSCYDVSDPGFSPPGTCQLNMVSLKFGRSWKNVPPGQYHRIKFENAEAMLNRAAQVLPGLRGRIEEVEMATPLTFMRYLGHPEGSIYGFEHHAKDAFLMPVGRNSPIRGLHFASGWTGDAGFQPTYQSGASAARDVELELKGK